MEFEGVTYHQVIHKYKEEIIIPLAAIEENIEYILNKGKKCLVFSDGVKALVTYSKEVHICEAKNDIERLYGCTAWEFMEKWHKVKPNMDSMTMLNIVVRKEEKCEEY